MGFSKFFLSVVLFLCFDKYVLCLSIVLRLFIRFYYSVNFVYFLCSLCIIINGSSVIIMKKFQLIFVYVSTKGLFIYDRCIVVFDCYHIY